MAIKKPRIRFRVRGFWILRLVRFRRALTRTSVGNEKYEDKGNERIETHADERGNLTNPARWLRDDGGVAVRHDSDPNEPGGRCQQLFRKCAESAQSRARLLRFGRLNVRTAGRPFRGQPEPAPARFVSIRNKNNEKQSISRSFRTRGGRGETSKTDNGALPLSKIRNR